MSYKSNSDKVEQILQVIESKIGTRVGIMVNLRRFLKENCNVWIYTEAPVAVRANYDDFLALRDRDILDFRASHFRYQYIRDKKMSTKYKHSRSEFMLHNQFETEDSLAWLFLHEVMHAMIRKSSEDNYYWIPSSISSMNWVHEDRMVAEYDNMYKYDELYKLDVVHEKRPEEQFCNLYATSFMGVNYDRHWWRKTKRRCMRDENISSQISSY